ncbi:hypothetical protein M0R45_009132 [Rubus argutus]|uniref:Uncharacterized protein n=1 Tax=Rubus argutus TaxID=59490 RepID=A0AAW1Y3Y7_RUBAR
MIPSLAKSKHVVSKDRPKSSFYQHRHEHDHTVGAKIKPAHYRAKSPIFASIKSPALDLGNQFAILETVPNEIFANVVESVVVPMVKECIEGSSLWK